MRHTRGRWGAGDLSHLWSLYAFPNLPALHLKMRKFASGSEVHRQLLQVQGFCATSAADMRD